MINSVWISQSLINRIIVEVEHYSPLETGGAFYGYYSEAGGLVVTHLIDAGPNAKRSKRSFEPDQEYQLQVLEKLFYEEDKALFYLGDWHSHPTSSPHLSWKDKRTLSRIANTPESNCINPLMVIFGSYPKPWNINCVQYKRASRRLLLFDSCEYEQLNLIVD